MSVKSSSESNDDTRVELNSSIEIMQVESGPLALEFLAKKYFLAYLGQVLWPLQRMLLRLWCDECDY